MPYLICPRSCSTIHFPNHQRPAVLFLTVFKAASSLQQFHLALGNICSPVFSHCNHILCQPGNQQLGNSKSIEILRHSQVSCRCGKIIILVQCHCTYSLPLMSTKKRFPKHCGTSLARQGRERKKSAPRPLFWLHTCDSFQNLSRSPGKNSREQTPPPHWARVMPPGRDLKHIHLSPGPSRAAVHLQNRWESLLV